MSTYTPDRAEIVMREPGTIHRTDRGEYVLAWGGQWLTGVYRVADHGQPRDARVSGLRLGTSDPVTQK